MNVLRERNFRLYFVGQTASAFGTAMVGVALAFAVLRLTRSATDLGVVLTSSAVSQLVFLLAGGVVADRVSRRLALIGSDSVRFAAEGILAILLLTTRPALVIVVVLVFVQGAASALFMPASGAIMPALVEGKALQTANSLMQTASSASSVLGPAVAGVLVVAVGPGWAIAVDAASYGVSVATLFMLRLPVLERGERHSFVADLREGWDEVRSRDWYWKAVVGFSVFNMLFALYEVLGPVASLRFYSGAKSWAVIATAMGIGSVAGGILSGRIRSERPLRVGLPLSGFLALPAVAIGARLPVPAVAVAAFLGGVGLSSFNTIWHTVVQRHIPEAVLARVTAYDWFGSLLAFPIGLALAAPLAAALGLRPVLLVSGCLGVVGVAAMLAVRNVRNLPATPVPAAESGPDKDS